MIPRSGVYASTVEAVRRPLSSGHRQRDANHSRFSLQLGVFVVVSCTNRANNSIPCIEYFQQVERLIAILLSLESFGRTSELPNHANYMGKFTIGIPDLSRFSAYPVRTVYHDNHSQDV